MPSTVTVTDDEDATHGNHQPDSCSVNDPGSFSGDTSATGSEDDSAITGTLAFITDVIDGDWSLPTPNYTITSESSNRLSCVIYRRHYTPAHGRTHQTPTSTAQILLL